MIQYPFQSKDSAGAVCLDDESVNLEKDKPLDVTGWGKTNTGVGGSISDTLNTVTLRHLPNQDCVQTWDFIIDSHLCCATDVNEGQGTCNVTSIFF